MSSCHSDSESLWAIFIIESHCADTITIKNVEHSWGKFCSGGLHPCSEISTSDIDGKTIASKKTYSIYTSGRQGSASGTTGSFDLYASNGDKIVTLSWDCPWGAGTTNVVQLADVPTDWMVSNSPYGPSGAIGQVTIKVAHME